VHSQNTLPAIKVLLRKIFSRTTAYLVLSFLVLLLIAFRLDDLLFEYRVQKAIRKIQLVRVNQTSVSELLRVVPDLMLHTGANTECGRQPCYSLVISSWAERVVYIPLVLHFPNLFDALHVVRITHVLGARIYANFYATFFERSNRVSYVAYGLDVSDGSEYPGLVRVEVNSAEDFPSQGLYPDADESPNFRIRNSFKWPDKSLRVAFVPYADPVLIASAFDLHLNCLWQLNGCQNVRQILPKVMQERDTIERATADRTASANPCPERILQHRVRDVEDILLVQVAKVGPRVIDSDSEYQLADYKLLEVLKGRVNRPLTNVGHPLRLLRVGESPESRVDYYPNPAIALLRSGNKLLMFGDSSTNIDTYCAVMQATPSALEMIRSELAELGTHK
jgi:hypothetical protein